MTRYAKPATLDEALALLGSGAWRILAGGTDFYPALGAKPLRENILDLNGISDLRGIVEADTHWRIGARATWSEVIRFPFPPAFNALKQAAREVGSVQIQNVASLAGNLCNASPAADGAPAFLVLGAEVEIRSVAGIRVLPLRDFILGNRHTALAAGEMVASIRVPKASVAGASSFVKLGARRYLVISIAMAATRLVIENDRVADALVAVGACSAVAVRLAGVEAALRGQPVDVALADVVRSASFDEIAPIDDVRGTADYRHDAAREIVARSVLRAAGLRHEDRAAA